MRRARIDEPRVSCLQPDGRPIPIGSILITDPSDPRERARGIEVAGVPVGEEAYVREYLAEKSLEIVSYVDKTLIQLQSIDPYALWSLAFYCLAPKAD